MHIYNIYNIHIYIYTYIYTWTLPAPFLIAFSKLPLDFGFFGGKKGQAIKKGAGESPGVTSINPWKIWWLNLNRDPNLVADEHASMT